MNQIALMPIIIILVLVVLFEFIFKHFYLKYIKRFILLTIVLSLISGYFSYFYFQEKFPSHSVKDLFINSPLPSSEFYIGGDDIDKKLRYSLELGVVDMRNNYYFPNLRMRVFSTALIIGVLMLVLANFWTRREDKQIKEESKDSKDLRPSDLSFITTEYENEPSEDHLHDS